MAGLERQIRERQVISDTLFELGKYPELTGADLALAICPLREGLMINSQETLDLESPLGRIQRTMDYLQTEVEIDPEVGNKLINGLNELRADELKIKVQASQVEVDFLRELPRVITDNTHSLDWKLAVPNYAITLYDLVLAGHTLANGNPGVAGVMVGVAALTFIGPRLDRGSRQTNRVMQSA